MVSLQVRILFKKLKKLTELNTFQENDYICHIIDQINYIVLNFKTKIGLFRESFVCYLNWFLLNKLILQKILKRLFFLNKRFFITKFY